MRIGQLASAIRHSAVFYPLVAAAIIVPNLVLGVYGYVAITSQQTTAENNVRGTWGTIVSYINSAILDRMRELERDLETRFNSAGGLTDASSYYARTAAENPLLRAAYLVVPPGEPSSPPDALGAGAPLWKEFNAEIWPELRSRVEQSGHVSVLTPHGQQTFLVRPITVGTIKAVALCWLDLDHVKRDVVQPRLDALHIEDNFRIDLRQVPLPPAPLPADPQWLVLERCDWGLAPHWAIGVRIVNMENFRESQRLAVAVYLFLVALLVPFIGFGTWALIRWLGREISEARQKTDFVSRVTHELKTPLTSIRLFIETLQMGGADSPDELARCLDIISNESERLQRLIERLLDFGKIEAGNKVYHFRDDNMEQVVRDTIDFFRKQAQKVGGVIRLYIERNLPVFSFDRDGVREILLNLLENAIKYSVGEKLVAIRVVSAKWRDQDSVQIQVGDNGVGIRREDLPLIFDKFYRVDDRLTKGIDGSGLGLTLAREIARAHGGDILVESQHGRGSKFTLVLPTKPVRVS
ncbi:MAG: sensor histidine kinase [Planctomycetota bacterium]